MALVQGITVNRIPDKNEKHITGRECRETLYIRRFYPKRLVPAFTYQALQTNTTVIPPRKINVFQKRPAKNTFFRLYFRRGDLPVSLRGRIIITRNKKLEYPVKWFCNPRDLDYCYYLPIFVDGLSESDTELRMLAQFATMDLIQVAPNKVLPVIPKLILPFKRAFNTCDKKIIISALKVLQQMVTLGPCVGQALVPYYRQLLAACNLFKNINRNLGEGVDYDRGNRIGDVIEDTLRMLEACGGPNAFINIKYMVPTYESGQYPKCVNPEVPQPPNMQI